jgi:uncharacterized protein (DUF1501 family)
MALRGDTHLALNRFGLGARPDEAAANDLRGLFASVLESHWGLEPRVVAQQVFPNAGVLRREAGLLRG